PERSVAIGAPALAGGAVGPKRATWAQEVRHEVRPLPRVPSATASRAWRPTRDEVEVRLLPAGGSAVHAHRKRPWVRSATNPQPTPHPPRKRGLGHVEPTPDGAVVRFP